MMAKGHIKGFLSYSLLVFGTIKRPLANGTISFFIERKPLFGHFVTITHPYMYIKPKDLYPSLAPTMTP